MKKLILLLTLSLLAVTFNSCSKDDDGNENGTTKLVKRIDSGDVRVFEYDSQNRLIKQIWDEEGQVVDGKPWEGTGYYITTTIVYEDNKMICTSSDLFHPGFKEIRTIYLDNAGYVTKIQTEKEDNYNATYTYKNGYISTISDAYPYHQSFSLVWNDGNIISVTESGGSYNFEDEYLYEYTDIPNKFSVNWFFSHGTEYFCLPAMNGTYSKNLPASCKEYSRGELMRSSSYTYTFDDDGYPITIVTTFSGGDSYTTTLSYY